MSVRKKKGKIHTISINGVFYHHTADTVCYAIYHDIVVYICAKVNREEIETIVKSL